MGRTYYCCLNSQSSYWIYSDNKVSTFKSLSSKEHWRRDFENTWPPFFVDQNVNIFVEANKKHVDNWTGMLKLVVEKLWCVPTTLPTFWKLSTSSQHYQLSKLCSNKNSERFSKVPFNKLILKNKLKSHHDPPFSIPFNRLTFHLCCWDIGRNSRVILILLRVNIVKRSFLQNFIFGNSFYYQSETRIYY